ncbi:MAG: protein kinase [Deltaproteobacteria bacterium]|nr:protein kinase [Deltaproteobacteria bacterium]
MTAFARLGKYHVLERLAAGPIAESYRVKTVGIAGFEKVQILHRISSRYGGDPVFVRAFIDEAKLAFSLNHRNIIQVFEFGKVDGDLFLATEHIPGVNLGELLIAAREIDHTPPVGLVCYLMGEVAAGLEYAHRKTNTGGGVLDVAHGDLCPHKIGCSWEGSVKVLDFGISRAAMETAEDEDRLRHPAGYVAPERIEGAPAFPLGDIFSFGVIMWEILAGRPLFAGQNPTELQDAILKAPIPPCCEMNSSTPNELDNLLRRCLQRDPATRLPSASELQLELHTIQRQLGAVIGSRSLATFLQEVFPERVETRDVHQSSTPTLLPKLPEAHEHTPSRSQAHEHTPSRSQAHRYTPSRAEPLSAVGPLERASSGLHPSSSSLDFLLPLAQEPRVAGVLRAPRDPDEEPDGRAPPRQRPLPPPLPTQARQATAEQSGVVSTTLPADPAEPHRDAAQASANERKTSPYREPLRRPTRMEAEEDADPLFADVSSSSKQLISSTEVSLGERKRFIALAIHLEGAPHTLAAALSLIEDIAYKRDGIVHERGPDRLTVLFGLPLTDENDIVSAVRAATEAREVSEDLSRSTDPPPEPMSIHIGIRVGTARMAAGGKDYHPLGNTLSETASLADSTPKGEVHVAGSAARLAAMHYVLREGRALRRMGKPIRCYAVLRPHPPEKRQGPVDTPLIGRDMELNALRGLWRDCAINRQQRSALIIGTAGQGKSRLLDEFLLRHSTDAHVFTASATPHQRETPNTILHDLLRSITGVPGGGSRRVHARLFERLREILPPHTGSEIDRLPDTLAALISPQYNDWSEDPRRREVHSAMRKLLLYLAEHHKLILVVENLHWADTPSLDFLATLVSRGAETKVPLLLLATARPEEGVPLDDVFPEGIASQIGLEDLNAGDQQQLLLEILGTNLNDDLAQAIERRAGGNPFYLRELAFALHESGASGLADIPASVRGVVASRVDRLPTDTKAVLQRAAVIGPVFREGILTSVLGRNPARSLAELRNSEIILPSSGMAVLYQAGVSEHFEREWAFRHLVAQEVIYEALSPADRKNLHAKVGEIMAQRAARGSSDPAAEIARHFEAAGSNIDAADYYLQAAKEAAASYANAEALTLFDKALALALDSDLIYEIVSGRERVFGRLGRHDEQASDLELLRRLSGRDDARLAELRVREALRLLRIGEAYRALEAAEEAEAAATNAQQPLLEGEALRLRAEAYERLDDHARALEAAKLALEIFRQHEALSHQVRAHMTIGRILLIQARYSEALNNYRPALELIRQLKDRWLERILRNHLAVVYLCRGNYPRALDEALYSLRLCVEFDDRAREGDNATVIGIIWMDLGHYAHARTYLDDALSIHRQTGSRWSEADTLVYVAILEIAARDFNSAIDLLCQAKGLAEDLGAKYIEVNARNTLAVALCDRNSTHDAEWALEEATTAAQIAHGVTLIVGEIPSLSRAARAKALLGDMVTARALSRRAVELLDSQKLLDGPEQEVYYTHYRILAADNDPKAAQYLLQAHEQMQAKLVKLKDPEHREGFCRVALNAAILRDVAAQPEQTKVDG